MRADECGTLKTKTNRGRTCSGNLVYPDRRHRRGSFTCNDGSSGPFDFVSTGTQGTGCGRLGKRSVTFTFGKQAASLTGPRPGGDLTVS